MATRPRRSFGRPDGAGRPRPAAGEAIVMSAVAVLVAAIAMSAVVALAAATALSAAATWRWRAL